LTPPHQKGKAPHNRYKILWKQSQNLWRWLNQHRSVNTRGLPTHVRGAGAGPRGPTIQHF